MSSPYTIELLGTAGCHLCEEAQLILFTVMEMESLQLAVIDIAEHRDSEQLIARYGVRIPVLRDGERELDWPFSAAQVLQWMQRS